MGHFKSNVACHFPHKIRKNCSLQYFGLYLLDVPRFHVFKRKKANFRSVFFLSIISSNRTIFQVKEENRSHMASI